MKQEVPQSAIIGAAVAVVALLIGLVYFFNRPEPIPEGKIDPTLTMPTNRAETGARFAPAQDNTRPQTQIRTRRSSSKQD